MKVLPPVSAAASGDRFLFGAVQVVRRSRTAETARQGDGLGAAREIGVPRGSHEENECAELPDIIFHDSSMGWMIWCLSSKSMTCANASASDSLPVKCRSA